MALTRIRGESIKKIIRSNDFATDLEAKKRKDERAAQDENQMFGECMTCALRLACMARFIEITCQSQGGRLVASEQGPWQNGPDDCKKNHWYRDRIEKMKSAWGVG